MVTRRQFLHNAGSLGALALSLGELQAGQGLFGQPEPTVALPENVIFETVRTDGLAHLSYLVGDRMSGRAAIIDPRRDVEVYLELARRHRLTITHALETHIHADFVSGSRELADRTRTARIHVSVEGNARYSFPHEALRDGTRIDLGSVTLTAIHTPGHTPEHVSYLAATRRQPNRPWAFFTGDFLFPDSVGRPDLLGAERTGDLAHQLFNSLRVVLRRVPDDVAIFPAHGAGSPCGANICDRQSTVGRERRQNPGLQFTEERRFTDWVLRTAPPIPRYYPRMKRINAQGPEILRGLPEVTGLSPQAFRQAIGRAGTQLVDNRDMLAFGGGHIAGALNIGPKPDLSLWAGWVLDPERPIALILTRPSDLPEVIRQFLRVGFTRFAGHLSGGIDAWVLAGLPVQTLPQMPVHALRGELQGRRLQVVDVRTPGEWDDGHVAGATYAFLPELTQRAARLDRSRPVAVYCASGYRSSLAGSLLQAQGFTQVYNVPGSWKAWTAAGFPVERPRERGRASDTNR